jgi:phage terminase large subunit GpA-like protein
MEMQQPIPTWMPETYRAVIRHSGHSIRFQPLPGVRRVMRRPRPMSIADWSERYRYVTLSAIEGPWRHENAPWAEGIMEILDFPSVVKVGLCKSVQSAGTETALNMVGSRIDQQSAKVIFVYPDKDTGRNVMKKRIVPMIRNTRQLSRHLTGYQDDVQGLSVQLSHTWIKIGWSGSPASLASDPADTVVLDEVDKYMPFTSNKAEAGPIELAEKRTTTFRRLGRAKIFMLSTPTTENGPIWKFMEEEAELIFDWHVRCPDCGREQKMAFSRIRWPEGSAADASRVESLHLAWYECSHCPSRWDDEKRDMAVRHGRWRSRDKGLSISAALQSSRPSRVGVHFPGWNSLFVTLSECAASFLRGLTSKSALRDFWNNYAAEPWKIVLESTSEAEALKARCALAPGMVANEAVALTCGIDQQHGGFFWVVRGWDRHFNSWLVESGFSPDEADLDHLLYERSWPIDGEPGLRMKIWRAARDSGGNAYDTGQTMRDEAYLWLDSRWGLCRGCQVWVTKGASTSLPTFSKLGNPLRQTRSGKKLRSGARLMLLDPNRLKTSFFERLENAIQGRGHAGYLHEGVAEGSDYLRQITAEELREEAGRQVWVQLRKDNHFLDCECIALAQALWEWPGGGVNLLQDRVNVVEETAPPPPPRRPKGERPEKGRKLPGWRDRM